MPKQLSAPQGHLILKGRRLHPFKKANKTKAPETALFKAAADALRALLPSHSLG